MATKARCVSPRSVDPSADMTFVCSLSLRQRRRPEDGASRRPDHCRGGDDGGVRRDGQERQLADERGRAADDRCRIAHAACGVRAADSGGGPAAEGRRTALCATLWYTPGPHRSSNVDLTSFFASFFSSLASNFNVTLVSPLRVMSSHSSGLFHVVTSCLSGLSMYYVCPQVYCINAISHSQTTQCSRIMLKSGVFDSSRWRESVAVGRP